MTRLRVVAYVIQPQLMADDGENLTPVTVNPVTIAAVDWPTVIERMAAGIEQLRQQIEGPAEVLSYADPDPEQEQQ